MSAVVASFGLLLAGIGCLWIPAHTPRGTPLWFDGPFWLGGFTLCALAIAGFVKAAL